MLKKVTSTDPAARIGLSLRQSTLDNLQAYRERYTELYGDEISQGMLIEEILKDYMEADREFQRWLRERKA